MPYMTPNTAGNAVQGGAGPVSVPLAEWKRRQGLPVTAEDRMSTQTYNVPMSSYVAGNMTPLPQKSNNPLDNPLVKGYGDRGQLIYRDDAFGTKQPQVDTTPQESTVPTTLGASFYRHSNPAMDDVWTSQQLGQKRMVWAGGSKPIYVPLANAFYDTASGKWGGSQSFVDQRDSQNRWQFTPWDKQPDDAWYKNNGYGSLNALLNPYVAPGYGRRPVGGGYISSGIQGPATRYGFR